MISTRAIHLFLAAILAASMFCFTAPLEAATFTIDFESLSDGDIVGTAFGPEVTFTNATTTAAGVLLNEIDFPPRSGTNVVYDSGGAMRLDFLNPVSSFFGYFSYVAPITLQFFDISANLLGSVASLYDDNTVSTCMGLPNERLFGAFDGTSFITITGASSGTSFVLDDVEFETSEVSVVPEPASAALLLAGMAFLIRHRKRARADIAARS